MTGRALATFTAGFPKSRSERAARLAAESEAKFRAMLTEKLKYTIAKLRHEKFGQSAERGVIRVGHLLEGWSAFRAARPQAEHGRAR